jgi:myo-inositol 2-dehydrogenase / D-chiro-inositol 1-dehydrogenase
MTGAKKVGVGIIGSGFAANLHVEAFEHVLNAEVVAVASDTESRARAFADKHRIPRVLRDYRKLLELEEVDLVTLALPNYLHAEACLAAAQAGKHVIVEKPLAVTLQQADDMIQACRRHGVKLMYAENLCFAPKYVRAKALVEEGAVGKLYMIKHSERHSGPHSPWFWDMEKAGGGAVLDMGCHALQVCRWLKDAMPIKNIYASMDTYMHAERTQGEDNAIILVTFEDGTLAVCETSWARLGGMDNRAELYGTGGVVYADVVMGSSLLTYSEAGYGYAVEKAASTQGWTFTMFEEAWNYGFPQEMQHFTDCVMNDSQPLMTGEDGRAVLEMVYAAYASAGRGISIDLPFRADAAKPIDLWKRLL